MTTIRDEEIRLRSVFPVLNRFDEVHNGMRIVYFSGTFLRDAEPSIWTLVKGALPADARVVEFEPGILFGFDYGGMQHDRYRLVFNSKEWAPIEPAGVIPELQVTFTRASSPAGPVTCATHDVPPVPVASIHTAIARINRELKTKHLLSVILDPLSSSKSVIQLAESLQEDFKHD